MYSSSSQCLLLFAIAAILIIIFHPSKKERYANQVVHGSVGNIGGPIPAYMYSGEMACGVDWVPGTDTPYRASLPLRLNVGENVCMTPPHYREDLPIRV